MNRFIAIAIAALSLGAAAEPATVRFEAAPPLSSAVQNPWAVSTTGIVKENITRDYPRYDNPWTPKSSPTGAAGLAGAYFTAVGAGASALFNFAPAGAVAFLWGTPDYYNKIEFLHGGLVVDSLSLTSADDISPAIKAEVGAWATITDITGGVFDAIRFSSRNDSFEFANLTALPPAPVPLPAGIVLMASAIGGMAIAGKRRRAA